MAKIAPAPAETEIGPRTASEMFGHGDAEQDLLAAYRSGRMHHAWLLAGAKGIGKATLAHRMARFIAANPDHRAGAVAVAQDLSTPETHEVVFRIHAHAFPDLIEITAETSQTAAGRGRPSIKVDQIHDSLRGLESTAGAGGWRMVIIDAADDMNAAAANAILKRLEEPPRRCVFFLVSHAPGRLLPTIRSRCRRLDLAPLDGISLTHALKSVSDRSMTGTDEVSPAVLALAGGSAGEAFRLMNEGGADLARALMQLVQSLPQLDLSAAHKLANRLTAQKADADFRLFCDLLFDWLAEAIRAAETGQASRFSPLEPQNGFAMFEAGSLAPWAALWENLGEAYARTLSLNLDRKQFLMNAFFALEATARGRSR